MTRTHPAWAGGGLVMVAVLSVAAALHFYRSTASNLSHEDPRTTFLMGAPERYRAVATMLPPDAVVQYLADFPLRRNAGWPSYSEFTFTAARYALAPRLLIPYQDGQAQPWVLADFSTTVDLAAIAKEHRLKLVKDFGSGVALLHGE